MILAGDVGGTKTNLALYKKNNHGHLECKFEQTFVSKDYSEFNDILSVFLQKEKNVKSVCLGIAGPVINQRCLTTNLPWTIDGKELSSKFGIPQVKLLNDLEAMAIGMINSSAEDLVELNSNAKKQKGNIAVIAAGTGLGEAILFWDGQQHHPIATEGGHCDFAAQTEQQDRFLAYLRKQFTSHVSWERVLSGNGFGYIYDFLVESGFASACPEVPPVNENSSFSNERNAIISQRGINNEDPVCVETVRLFAELYAAEAGNLALKSFSNGGVFIGGGIGPKIRPALENDSFIRAFTSKGRFKNLLSTMSIKLSLNPNTPLIGAAHYFKD